jgi:hypothetical protein
METKLRCQSNNFEISPSFFFSFPRGERAVFFPALFCRLNTQRCVY